QPRDRAATRVPTRRSSDLLHRMGCNSITGRYINAKWSQQSIKLGVQHDTVSAVNIIFTDGRNCANLEYNAVIECDVTNIFQRTRSEEHTSELKSRFDLVCS